MRYDDVKVIFMILGFIALGLGAIGVVLSMIPTTPFLLVSAACFAKSSDKLNNWFKGTKIYKDNLESFVKKEGMQKVAKIRIMTTVTILFAIAAYFMRNTVIGLIVIGTIWFIHVIAFIFFIKTKNMDNGSSI